MQTHRNIFKQRDSAKALCEKLGMASAQAAPDLKKRFQGWKNTAET